MDVPSDRLASRAFEESVLNIGPLKKTETGS
jgi:hypothetical protein